MNIYELLLDAPVVTMPMAWPPQPPVVQDLRLSIMTSPEKFEVTEAEAKVLNRARKIIAEKLTNHHLNQQKSQWIYNKLLGC